MCPLTTSPLRSRLAAASSHNSYQMWFPRTVYAIGRLFDVVLILIAARHQIATPAGATALAGYKIWEPSPASPGYGSVASNWDGQWHFSIASHGYPSTIPRDAAGQALQNQWGFYPLYPFIVGAIMGITGAGFTVVAPTLSLLLGAAAVTVMFRLISQGSRRFAASATVLLTCTYMAAPAMQTAYTREPCPASGLHRAAAPAQPSVWLARLGLAMLGLTRGIALAFVPVLTVHGIYRYRHVFPLILTSVGKKDNEDSAKARGVDPGWGNVPMRMQEP
jgi:hypothetical protein